MIPGADDEATVRGWLAQHPARVAPHLLGATLVSSQGGQVRLRITEVEAYGGVGEDPGSHAHRRPTARNQVMFGPPGHVYVYFTYGMHWCLNVVAHEPGMAGAVLVRAGEVLAGHPLARARRRTALTDRDLARGPARLAAALGVTGELDGADLLDASSPLRLELPDPRTAAGQPATGPGHDTSRLVDPGPGRGVGPRTGVPGDGAATPWRFWLLDDPTVSPYRAAAPRRAKRAGAPSRGEG